MLKAMEGGQVFGGFASKAWVDKGEVREKVCRSVWWWGDRGRMMRVCVCLSVCLSLSRAL